MNADEINAARRSLSAFRSEFQRVTGWARSAGKSAAKAFGGNFKSIAVFTIRELARGALPAIGARIVENWGKTGTKMGRTFGKRAKKAATDELKTMSQSMGSGFSFDLKNFLKITGATALGAMIYQQVKGSFETAFEQERITISMDALSVDGQGGKRLFEEFRKDALRTGIDVSAQAGIVQKMLAQGIDEGGALKLNRAMLDIAGGTGLTTNEVELLGTALSQIKGKGVAAMEELRGQIAEKGVPIFEALRQRFSKETVAEVFDAIAAGKVTAEDVLETFANLEGPFQRFLGASDRLGQTGGGLVSRLKQEAIDLQRVFMADVMPELKPVIEQGIGLIQRLKDGAKEFGANFAEAIGKGLAAFEALSLREMFELAGLALKRELLEAMDAGQRGANALVAALKDDSFGSMLEQSALRFKSIMLGAAAEMIDAMSSLPGMGERAEVTAYRLSAGADLADAQREALVAEGGPTPADFWKKVQEEFKNAPSALGFSEADAAQMDRLLARIDARRSQNLADRQPDAPIVAPAATGGGRKTPYDPSGMLGGSLANALSKITGGGDIILSKQLAEQQSTRAATEQTAKAAERTAAAVEKLVANTNPRRSRDPQARLVL